MAQRTRSKTAGKAGARASGRGQQALDRLHESIEAAEAALKDLRSEMSRGSRALLKDVDSTLRDARKNARSVRRRVAKELEQAQQAAGGKKPATGRKAATRSTGRKAATRSTGRKAATRSTGRKAATRSTARKTTARRTAGKKAATK